MSVDKNGPLLSVVIPVRNGMPYIREAIASVLEQLTDEMELIVRDNRSTDGTSEYLAAIDEPRVRVISAESPGSVGTSWSATCALARGTYTKLLCADDTILPGGLARQLSGALAHPDAVLVASRRRIIDETGRVVMPRHGLSRLTGQRSGRAATARAIASGGNPFGEPSSVLFRTDALRSGLPFSEDALYLVDVDMYLRVLRQGEFLGLSSIDATFRLSSTSWSYEIGRAQLRQYRAWRDGLITRREIVVSRRAKVVSDTASVLRFAARRAVAGASGLAGKFRR